MKVTPAQTCGVLQTSLSAKILLFLRWIYLHQNSTRLQTEVLTLCTQPTDVHTCIITIKPPLATAA